MARSTRDGSTDVQKLRKLALSFPEAEEGIACKGTALECATFKVKKKAFLFLKASELRLKLQQSLAEAAKLAAKEPDVYQVGGQGWVKVTFREPAPLAAEILDRWLKESYQLMSPSPLTGGAAPANKSASLRKTARRKVSRE